MRSQNSPVVQRKIRKFCSDDLLIWSMTTLLTKHFAVSGLPDARLTDAIPTAVLSQDLRMLA